MKTICPICNKLITPDKESWACLKEFDYERCHLECDLKRKLIINNEETICQQQKFVS